MSPLVGCCDTAWLKFISLKSHIINELKILLNDRHQVIGLISLVCQSCFFTNPLFRINYDIIGGGGGKPKGK